MSEKYIETEFKKYKARFIKKLGNHALDNEEIDAECLELFGSKYRGCHSVDTKFPLKPGYYVVNLDMKSGPGTHWISMYLTKKTAHVFDSFARDIDKIAPILTKRLRRAKFKIKFDTKDKEQRPFYNKRMTVSCGHSCIAFLLCVHKFGIRKAILI
tara:strand:+ start:349 stop:816 length:468 start_codon:yes stop_codon:yes gene_type:complete